MSKKNKRMNFKLDWSELTKRVYITNGKKKKDVTEWFEKIVSEQGVAKIISSKPLFVADGDIFAFAMYLTGHDEETIKQMYRDWH